MELAPEERAAIERRFIWIATLAAVFLAAIPALLYAQLVAPKGSSYLGFEFNTDDHMVYAAWMRQAMDGRFLFDNRFTTDPQPGLTVHLYFWILGLIAKLVGIPVAANLGRLVFTGLFVPLLYRFVKRVSDSVFVTRLAVSLTVLGGGVGFLVWDNFGRAIDPPRPGLSGVMLGMLPIDVWQPEAFVFPSMLTNGLFMVSLCLILVIFQGFLDARNGWKPVLWSAVALGILMNIHSYDVLTIAFVMVGFLLMQTAAKQLTAAWLGRGLVIGLGVVPAALWFMHVLQSDAVFQARSQTLTYSANFRQVFFGYFLMFLLAIPGLLLRFTSLRQRIGVGLFGLLLVVLFCLGTAPSDTYFLGMGPWAGIAVISLTSLALMATEDATMNLLLAWAVMGLIALYFPALFQRKLAMGLSIPWAILATLGFAQFVQNRERSARNLATVLVILLLSATSIFWLVRREPYLLRNNVSNTVLHPVFLNHDEQQIIAILNQDHAERRVVIAMPGVFTQEFDQSGELIPDRFAEPTLPDLNPILSGLCGVYTYAGHWSETPDYNRRRGDLMAFYDARFPKVRRDAFVARIMPDYVVQPSEDTFGPSLHAQHIELADLTSLGEVVYSGSQFALIKIRH